MLETITGSVSQQIVPPFVSNEVDTVDSSLGKVINDILRSFAALFL